MVQERIQLLKNKLEKHLCLTALCVLDIVFQVGFFFPLGLDWI